MQVLLCRITLVLIIPLVAYAALYPGFASYHYVPHALLREVGVPYAAVLWFEIHLGDIMHFFVAFVLVLLIPSARILGKRPLGVQRAVSLSLVAAVAPVIEIYQWITGRGFGSIDLIAHCLGMLLAVGLWQVTSTNIESDLD